MFKYTEYLLINKKSKSNKNKFYLLFNYVINILHNNYTSFMRLSRSSLDF